MADRKLSQLAELTDPATADTFLVLDASISNDANKNKKIEFGTLFTHIPDGTVSAPSFSFSSDTGATGFYRSGADEIGISIDDTYKCKFTSAGFQLGTGTAAAQLHTFKTSTGDDVIIENSNNGSAEGPNVVLYRNSGSPADNDVLGTIEFRGEDSGDNTQSYAELTAGIVDATAGSEDGRIDLNIAVAGSQTTLVRLQEGKVGVNESAPEAPIHITNGDTQIVRLECPNNDAASGADITLYRHRNGAVGQDNDSLSTLFFRGHNDNGTASQREVDYASIQSVISDASNNSEDGKLQFKVQTAGTLTTQLEVDGSSVVIPGNLTVQGQTTINSTIPVDKGGTGQTTYSNGELLIGNSSGSLSKATLTAGSNVTITEGNGSITIASSGGGGGSNTAGDGIDISGSEISVDLKANGGLAIESTKIALDLGASAITGTLGVSDGGTGLTATPTNGQLAIGNGSGYTLSTLTAGSNVTITEASGSITIASSGGSNVTAGDGIDVTGSTVSTDLKANGGLVIESTELALDLGASAITGTLAVGDGGTGLTGAPTNGQIPIGNGSGYTLATLTAGSNVTITEASGSITIASAAAALTAGDGIDVSGSAISTDLKANGGLVIESTEVALDLGASAITGTLGVSDGGTGLTAAPTNGQIPIGNGSGYTLATLTAGSNVTITEASGSITIASSGGGSGITDGDKGDITVSNSGATWNIDAGVVGTTEIADDAVTAAKLADTAVTAGAYTSANITVDAQGRVTAASNGSSGSGGITSIVQDTTPQLGGDLDVNGNDIVSVSNGDIDLDPNGSGVVVFKGNATKGSGQFKLNCENNSHGITIKGPPHSAGANYTLTLPNNDGNASQYLQTNGSGVLSWASVSGGITDGDKGDITVSNSGATWNIDAGVIANAAISSTAEIAVSKLANGTARQLLQTDAAGTGVEFASNIDVPGTLDVTSAATFDNNVTVQGNLTVNGTTTTIDSTTLVVEDKNIEMGAVTTPTDTTADGGGITLKGATDKTFNWVNSTDSWTASEHIDLASGKEFKIAGTSVLSGSTLGAGVTASSLTSIGTIATGVWNGTAIGRAYGGTGLTAAPTNGQLLIGNGTGYALSTLTAGSNITITEGSGSITIAASGGGSVSAGDGIDVTGSTVSVDLKANGGLVIESTELAVDLAASAITGTLAVGNGGSGATTLTGILKGNGTSAFTAATEGTDYLSNSSTIDGGTF